ncbi:hypothetical protein CEXT_587551 [Caerostris extrusa]|uniref:Uncharacterized protein n=1 Tax=Caerostris extrusa TaxID=172846 RepID=A0AAV4R392_CAEEX|nr:hypothetical protein CEXT_587551 [Caerostris extrusa]
MLVRCSSMLDWDEQQVQSTSVNTILLSRELKRAVLFRFVSSCLSSTNRPVHSRSEIARGRSFSDIDERSLHLGCCIFSLCSNPLAL